MPPRFVEAANGRLHLRQSESGAVQHGDSEHLRGHRAERVYVYGVVGFPDG